MNILLITLGSAGDVHPFIGLGLGLKRKGHHVIIITNEYFKELIQNSGLEFIKYGIAEDYFRIATNPSLWIPRRGFKMLMKEAFLPAIRPIYEIIEKFDPTETVVVSSLFMFGARIAHERLKIPLVTVQLQPSSFWSVYNPPVIAAFPLPTWIPLSFKRLIFNITDRMLDNMLAPGINKVRAELGLPQVQHIFSKWMHSSQRIIGLFPDWFAAPAQDWPENTYLTGFILFDRSNKIVLSKEVMDFLNAGDPPIVFTPGTAMHHGGQFFKASVEACQLIGKRAILLTTYQEQVPEQLPEGIAHFDYLPLSALLPHVAALVHHGGIGTTAQGLSAGIPQLIMPMNYDQPDNATRLKRLGVGMSIPPVKYKDTTVARKLEHLLSSPEVKMNCKYWSKKIDFNSSVRNACKIIEQVVKG